MATNQGANGTDASLAMPMDDNVANLIEPLSSIVIDQPVTTPPTFTLSSPPATTPSEVQSMTAPLFTHRTNRKSKFSSSSRIQAPFLNVMNSKSILEHGGQSAMETKEREEKGQSGKWEDKKGGEVEEKKVREGKEGGDGGEKGNEELKRIQEAAIQEMKRIQKVAEEKSRDDDELKMEREVKDKLIAEVKATNWHRMATTVLETKDNSEANMEKVVVICDMIIRKLRESAERYSKRMIETGRTIETTMEQVEQAKALAKKTIMYRGEWVFAYIEALRLRSIAFRHLGINYLALYDFQIIPQRYMTKSDLITMVSIQKKMGVREQLAMTYVLLSTHDPKNAEHWKKETELELEAQRKLQINLAIDVAKIRTMSRTKTPGELTAKERDELKECAKRYEESKTYYRPYVGPCYMEANKINLVPGKNLLEYLKKRNLIIKHEPIMALHPSTKVEFVSLPVPDKKDYKMSQSASQSSSPSPAKTTTDAENVANVANIKVVGDKESSSKQNVKFGIAASQFVHKQWIMRATKLIKKDAEVFEEMPLFSATHTKSHCAYCALPFSTVAEDFAIANANDDAEATSTESQAQEDKKMDTTPDSDAKEKENENEEKNKKENETDEKKQQENKENSENQNNNQQNISQIKDSHITVMKTRDGKTTILDTSKPTYKPTQCRKHESTGCEKKYCSAQCESLAWNSSHAAICGLNYDTIQAEINKNGEFKAHSKEDISLILQVIATLIRSEFFPVTLFQWKDIFVQHILEKVRRRFDSKSRDIPNHSYVFRYDYLEFVMQTIIPALEKGGIDEKIVLDARFFSIVLLIIKQFSTNIMSISGKRVSTGIYRMYNMIRHSCLPNAKIEQLVSQRGNSISCKATRDIMPGEEIMMCYVPEELIMASDRKREWLLDLGIVCECRICVDQFKAKG